MAGSFPRQALLSLALKLVLDHFLMGSPISLISSLCVIVPESAEYLLKERRNKTSLFVTVGSK